MSDAYQAWRETREHLKQEPDSTFLQRVEETLRPAALEAFLDKFVTEHSTTDYDAEMSWGDVDPAAIPEFLAELDELRQPTAVQQNAQLGGVRVLVRKTLQEMAHLNWTGDHTYGDALDDAFQVLNHVLAGNNNWPQLERFQCPSEYGSKARQNERVRCELQLPHESKHRARNTAGGEGYMWTDEQSVNPPKNYDEPVELCGAIKNPRPGVTYRCDKSKGHGGQHADIAYEKAWNVEPANPDPINRPPVELTGEQLDDLATEVFGDGECGAVNPDLEPNPLRKGKSICVRAKAHGGLHRDADGIRWEK